MPVHPLFGRLNDWTASYTLTASNEDEARKYAREKAERDVPGASIEVISAKRDKGSRSYWRVKMRRVRNP